MVVVPVALTSPYKDTSTCSLRSPRPRSPPYFVFVDVFEEHMCFAHQKGDKNQSTSDPLHVWSGGLKSCNQSCTFFLERRTEIMQSCTFRVDGGWM